MLSPLLNMPSLHVRCGICCQKGRKFFLEMDGLIIVACGVGGGVGSGKLGDAYLYLYVVVVCTIFEIR